MNVVCLSLVRCIQYRRLDEESGCSDGKLSARQGSGVCHSGLEDVQNRKRGVSVKHASRTCCLGVEMEMWAAEHLSGDRRRKTAGERELLKLLNEQSGAKGPERVFQIKYADIPIPERYGEKRVAQQCHGSHDKSNPPPPSAQVLPTILVTYPSASLNCQQQQRHDLHHYDNVRSSAVYGITVPKTPASPPLEQDIRNVINLPKNPLILCTLPHDLFLAAVDANITHDIDIDQCCDTLAQLVTDREEKTVARDLFLHSQEAD
ncbi:hypothetical protein EGR_06407 [Echinococcus granulosus]|uniref:DUF5726 domain-containing protein n=1 Tax=Echinococcus granulosus TaxID=6210 RepID=W6UD58_ECHGR|nr:hypothetical protein EGR_06407 [Echinococcus granulosus]EUB58736.1 hypothetical protein EGR_06407 [Echinococcus granulosus]